MLFVLREQVWALPNFILNDQYGKSYKNTDFVGKPSLFLTCFANDIDLCRKIGRKIYWKLQNLLWSDSDQVHFQLVLLIPDENVLVNQYIQESKNKGYESVLIDRKGYFSDHVKKGMAHLDIHNKQGKAVHFLDYSSIDEEGIQEIHKLLKPLL